MSFTNIKTAEQVEASRVNEASKSARSKRDTLLSESDFIVLGDYPLADKSAWLVYRQDLRDITSQTGFPDSITWPTKPA